MHADETGMQPGMSLPAWMSSPQESKLIAVLNKTARPRYIRNSILELSQALDQELHSEEMARQKGFLQGMEPRLKLLLVLAMILLVGLTHDVRIMLAVLLLSVIFMRLSRLPVWTLLKRIWFTIPLFTLLLALPAALNLINPGAPLLVIGNVSLELVLGGYRIPEQIFISQPGARAVLFIFLRVGLSISWGVLLVCTTPIHSLVKAMRGLKLPSLLVMIFELSIRYLALLIGMALEMFEARQVRSVGELSLQERQRQVGSAVGALFIRSMQMSEEMYEAMTARGYTGKYIRESNDWAENPIANEKGSEQNASIASI